MKKTLYYIFLSGILILSAACSDFLDEESRQDIDKSKYMLNAKQAETVLLGVYRNMVDEEMYGYHMSILFTLGTDIAQVEGSTNENFRIIPTNSFSANQREIQTTWAALYKGIYNANDFLEGIEEKMGNYSTLDKKLANIYIAEARGLRALYYFELVRRYGNIALMTNTAMSQQLPSTFTQADPVEVYKFIEEDLLFAIENLPYSIGDEDIRSDNSFRFSKGAAQGLLAKVYATWAGAPIKDESKWEEAAKIAQVLINSNKHGLLEDYEQLWKNSGSGVWNGNESLIEVSFYSPTSSMASDPIGRIGKWNGVRTSSIAGERGRNAGNVKVIHPFVLEWREYENDLRRDLSVANYEYNPGKVLYVKTSSSTEESAILDDADPTKRQRYKQNYTPAKWDIEKYVTESNKLISNDYSNVNWYVLRYADVLLIYAEAMNEWKKAPTADAYNAVNMVRRRGYGLPVYGASNEADLPVGLSYEDFRDAVRKERAFELAFEGHRRLDLIRWDIYYETVQETVIKLGNWWEEGGSPNYAVATPGYTTKGKHELFPIPQRDMDIMSQFNQNPNW